MGNKHEMLVVDDNPRVIAAARRFGLFGHLYQSFGQPQMAVEALLKV